MAIDYVEFLCHWRHFKHRSLHCQEQPTRQQILIIVLVLFFSSFALLVSIAGAKVGSARKAHGHASLRAMSRIHQARGSIPRAKALLVKSLHTAENQTDSGRLLKVLEAQIQLARKTDDTAALAKLQKRIDKLRASRHYASALVAKAIR
ncbi:MAG: hypothetical protein JSW47_07935 [Phycisphaerales bacterium]|nr:MAG: hypothetical protein JSW47_07935 [Phycisphaerales bacterium]